MIKNNIPKKYPTQKCLHTIIPIPIPSKKTANIYFDMSLKQFNLKTSFTYIIYYAKKINLLT